MTGTLDQLAAAVLGITRPRPGPPPEPAAFVFDQAILATPAQATDVGYAAAPAADERYPQTLVLTGSVIAGQPLCRPLFPGRLLFLGGPAASRPTADEVTRDAFAGWNTEGTLLVDLHDDAGKPVDPATEAWLRQLTTDLPEAMPTRLWYATVRIPAALLFDALPVLAPADAPAGVDGALTAAHRGRIAAFLRGEWGPVLRHDDRAAPCGIL